MKDKLKTLLQASAFPAIMAIYQRHYLSKWEYPPQMQDGLLNPATRLFSFFSHTVVKKEEEV